MLGNYRTSLLRYCSWNLGNSGYRSLSEICEGDDTSSGCDGCTRNRDHQLFHFRCWLARPIRAREGSGDAPGMNEAGPAAPPHNRKYRLIHSVLHYFTCCLGNRRFLNFFFFQKLEKCCSKNNKN